MKNEIDNLNQQLTTLLFENGTFRSLLRFARLHALKAVVGLSKTLSRFWNQEAAGIQELKEDLKAEILSAKAEMVKIQAQAVGLEALETELKAVQTENEAASTRQATLERQVQTATQQYDAMIQKIAQQEQRLSQLKADYNLLVTKLEGIQQNFEPFEKAHQANSNVFEAHFAENKQIWEVLQGNDAAAQQLVQNLEQQLKAFDAALKTTVEMKDKLEIQKINL